MPRSLRPKHATVTTRTCAAALLSVAMALPAWTFSPLGAQAGPPRSARAGQLPAAYALIREADIRRDLYAMASDAMRGREAGTPDEMRASVWVAEQLRTIGVKPLGDDGSYFQWFTMYRTRVSTVSSMGTLGEQPLQVWKDFIPLGSAGADVQGPVVWIANSADSTVDVRGKVVATPMLRPFSASIRTTTNSPEVRYTQAAVAAMQQRFESARARGKVLRYVGRLSAEGTATVGVVELDARHPFANIALTDNVVRFATSRYNNNPMIVQGPGAGPEVTAGGIFADLLRLSAYLGARL